MSQYFRKFIKKDSYPVHYSDIKFKTYFTNCIQESFLGRSYKQTEDTDWNIYWCEKQFIAETLDKLRLFPDKRINHFRNFYEICRKDLLSRNVKKYKKTLEKEGKNQEALQYDFLPLTYNLPIEYPIFAQEFKRSKDKQKSTWIMKPIGRSQGKGIFLFKSLNEISEWSQINNQPEAYIVQRYISNPLLIGNKKFDMRIYVLVTSHNPLVIYLYRSGFARFTHERYDANDIYNNEMHLTNVAVQKNSDNYDEERGGKYLLDKLRIYMLSKFGEDSTEKCFFLIQNLIIKTLIATSKLIINDKRCFELYGFDIMLDSNLKPWLIQINGSPSMTANTPIDRNLKIGLLDDTITIVNVEKMLFGDEDQIGGFDLIYKGKLIKQKIKNTLSQFNDPYVNMIQRENISFLGCWNHRLQQMRRMAKIIAMRLGEKVKEEEEQRKKLQINQSDKNNRNKSTNVPPPQSKQSINKNNNKNFAISLNHNKAPSIPPSNRNHLNNSIRLGKVEPIISKESTLLMKTSTQNSLKGELELKYKDSEKM